MGIDFPTVQLPSGRKRKFYKGQYKNKFENGQVISRRQYSRGIWLWTLTWENIPLSDFELIQIHFDLNVGDTFKVYKQLLFTPEDKIVRYSESELECVHTHPGYCSLSLSFEED